MQLDRFRGLSASLDTISPSEIKRVFPNPSLIEIEGDRSPPLFVSVLLHGNETSGLEVLKALRQKLARGKPARSLMIFVGNVDATAQGLRFVDGQPDHNRIWAGGDTAFHKMAKHVTDLARQAKVFASIDVHNNTGANPLYGCVSVQRAADLHLAARFAPQGVYYRNPPTTLSIAFSKFCPSITLECGQPGEAHGIQAALDLIDYASDIDAFPEQPPATEALTMYETVGRVLVSPRATIGFGDEPADIIFPATFEAQNFKPVQAGSVWAQSRVSLPLVVLDELGHDLTGNFFERSGDKIRLLRDVVPAMITRDKDVIAKDCLCYLMVPENDVQLVKS